MNYITILYSTRKIMRAIAKLFAWLTGIQSGILFLMAIGADAPLPFTSAPAIQFGFWLSVYFIVPRIIDLLICKNKVGNLLWRANKVGNKSAR